MFLLKCLEIDTIRIINKYYFCVLNSASHMNVNWNLFKIIFRGGMGGGGVFKLENFKGETILVLVITLLSVVCSILFFGLKIWKRKARRQLCLYSELFTDLGRCYHDCQGGRVFGCVILSNKLMPHKLFISVITELQPVLSIDHVSVTKLPHDYASVGSHNIMKQSKHSLIWKNIFWLIKINMWDIFYMTM